MGGRDSRFPIRCTYDLPYEIPDIFYRVQPLRGWGRVLGVFVCPRVSPVAIDVQPLRGLDIATIMSSSFLGLGDYGLYYSSKLMPDSLAIFMKSSPFSA
jgi:hypothetical protein